MICLCLREMSPGMRKAVHMRVDVCKSKGQQGVDAGFLIKSYSGAKASTLKSGCCLERHLCAT